jgi:hypothetical protein
LHWVSPQRLIAQELHVLASALRRGLGKVLVECLKPFDIGYSVWSKFGSLTPFVLLPAQVRRAQPTHHRTSGSFEPGSWHGK